MERLSCKECKQCNRKGKPSVLRFSKYCDEHHKHRIVAKKGLFGWLTDVKDKFYNKRVEYNEDGSIKDMNTKGFRKDWFFR